jgi:hypothetical protein
MTTSEEKVITQFLPSLPTSNIELLFEFLDIPSLIVIPAKLLFKLRLTVLGVKSEAGGDLIVDKTSSNWTVSQIKQELGGTNHVDYDRTQELQYHTHPLSTVCNDEICYSFALPSVYDVILLALADAYTGKSGKLGFVFTLDAIYTMEVEKLLFKGSTEEELHEYLKFAFYDLYNWVGMQMVKGKSIFRDLDCLNDYFSYCKQVHGIKVCRYSWPDFHDDIKIQPSHASWLLERGKFLPWHNEERRKISNSISPVLGYLKDNWIPSSRFSKY